MVTEHRPATGTPARRLEGERKPVTALFADVVGSTTLAERLDPEDWSEIMRGAFERFAAVVERYGGVVTQLVGDGLLAVFGAPVAHEDDPARAAMAGLGLIAASEEYAASLGGELAESFSIRVGINTGPVVISRMGGEREEYTALGDPVNVAARLQAAAAPGSVLVTDATRRLIGPGAEFRSLGQLAMKGKTEPVDAFELLAIGEHSGRSRGLPGLSSPMVGRDVELERLTQLLRTARAGSGRMALVIGEPGIGKSRLIAELRRSARELGLGWHEARCLSYGQALPLHLAGEVVRSLLALPEDGLDAEAIGAATAQLLGDEVASDEVAPLLAHMLGVRLSPDAAENLTRLDPETLASHYFLSLRRIVTAAAADPLVIVLEDIHWADPASVTLLTKLLSVIGPLRVLIVGVTRPDRETPGWELVTAARNQLGDVLAEVQLAALPAEHARSLVANLLAIESLTDATREQILRRADGNPFFVEEIIRMLIDRGAIEYRDGRWIATPAVESVRIPDSIHGLLLARIDRLADEERRTLRMASVIGRQFGTRVLDEILNA